MIIYKYLSAEYGLQLLMNKRIKVTHPKDFNDPFELLPAVQKITKDEISNSIRPWYVLKLYEQAIKEGRYEGEFYEFVVSFRNDTRMQVLSTTLLDGLKQKIKELRDIPEQPVLITCFSETEPNTTDQEILMWAHYAASHSGVRVSFDMNKLSIREKDFIKVIYSSERLILNVNEYFETGPVYLNEFFNRSLYVKSDIWKYEEERRWFLHIESCLKDEELYFIQINPKAIVGIDYGLSCSQRSVDMINKSLECVDYEHVKVKYLELDDYKYRMIAH